MKKLIFTVCGLALAVLVIAQELALNTTQTFSNAVAVFGWNATSYNFGKIKLNEPVTHEFAFINKGDAPLIISSVQASCGCTVTDYSKKAIEPGGQGFVKATYNAAHVGQFSKTVTVNANTEDNVVQLTIKGEVIE